MSELSERIAQEMARVIPVEGGWTVGIGSLGIKLYGTRLAADECRDAINAQIAVIIAKHLPQPEQCPCESWGLIGKEFNPETASESEVELYNRLHASHLAPQPAQPREVWEAAIQVVDSFEILNEEIEINDDLHRNALIREIVAVLRCRARDAPQPAAWQEIDATIYCEQCGKHVPLLPITTNNDWGDIVCPECLFVIASIATPAEGVYALTVESSQEGTQ